ncbi:uncharacterized protein LOC101734168 isoform X2 [Xenopus tropicalis]|uniref:Uncharacterized protein LOC101734168 isoform X2 n=1 Tax=Xenopus tropicalis TaxID=8364 RepID=A0A8J1JQU8_XENTR|nr:uncharacterized protein LOC101734168 isoform X2 [Xenopus tropicalis]
MAPHPMVPPHPAPLACCTNSQVSTGPAYGMGDSDMPTLDFEEGELPHEEPGETFSITGSLSPDHFFSTQPPPSPPPLSPPESASYEPSTHHANHESSARRHSICPRQVWGAQASRATQGTEARQRHRAAGAAIGVPDSLQPSTTQIRSTGVRRAASTRSTSPGVPCLYSSPTPTGTTYHHSRPRLRDTSGHRPRFQPVAVPATSPPVDHDIPTQDRSPTVADLQGAGASSGTGGDRMPSIPMALGGGQLLSMVRSSVTPATWQAYGNAWSSTTPVVLLVGHSYLRRAERRAAIRPGGRNLGFHGVDMVWKGISGLRWLQVLPEVFSFSRIYNGPIVLVVHAGGNDLGTVKVAELITLIKSDLERCASLFTKVVIVWSEIVPRLVWRGARKFAAIDQARKLLNARISRFVRSKGWVAWRHCHLEGDTYRFLTQDGVHLNDIGHDIFLSGLQDGIERALGLLVGGGRSSSRDT